MVSSRLRTAASPYTARLARPLAALGLSPNSITLIGLFFSFITALMYISHNLIFAFIGLLFTSLADAADGAVAKISGKTTRFGGFLDSVADRYSDALILLGIGVYLGDQYLLVLVALVGTLLVSYTRARAEMEIDKCDVGIGERAERLVILSLATLLEASNILQNALLISLVLLIVLTHSTALQRIWYTYRALNS